MPNIEQLKMIQAVIGRLAGNSFLLKGWTITLVAGLTGFSAARADRSLALIAVFVVCVLGVLDAYYLALERLYRQLYEAAADEGAGSWTITASRPRIGEMLRAMRAAPVLLLHGTALIVAAAVALSA